MANRDVVMGTAASGKALPPSQTGAGNMVHDLHPRYLAQDCWRQVVACAPSVCGLELLTPCWPAGRLKFGRRGWVDQMDL